MANKRRTDTLPKQIQKIVKDARAQAIQPPEKEARETKPLQPVTLRPPATQNQPHPLLEDIIRSLPTPEIEKLLKIAQTELRIRGQLSVPDLSEVLLDWKRRHNL